MEDFLNIRENISEVLGVEASNNCTDFQIRNLLQTYQGRPDIIECVIQSLCEANFDREEIITDETFEDIVTDEGFVYITPGVEVCNSYE